MTAKPGKSNLTLENISPTQEHMFVIEKEEMYFSDSNAY